MMLSIERIRFYLKLKESSLVPRFSRRQESISRGCASFPPSSQLQSLHFCSLPQHTCVSFRAEGSSQSYDVSELSSRTSYRDFSGGPVVKTRHFPCRRCGFNPCSGNREPMSHTVWPKKNRKKEHHTPSTGQKPREWEFGINGWKHTTLLLVKDQFLSIYLW